MGNIKGSKKLIGHAMRTIKHATQLIEYNRIVKYESGNRFWINLFKDEKEEKISWNDFKKKYVELINKKLDIFLQKSLPIDHDFGSEKNSFDCLVEWINVYGLDSLSKVIYFYLIFSFLLFFYECKIIKRIFLLQLQKN